MVNFTQRNIFIQFKNVIAKQELGLGMGSSDSPSIANITLLFYEINCLNSIYDYKIFKRYLDDILCIISYSDFFDYFSCDINNLKNSILNLYPSYLDLTFNINSLDNTFLDIVLYHNSNKNHTIGMRINCN